MSPYAETPNRYEINREVNGILTRHAVDLTQLSVSSSTTLVYLNGMLLKSTGSDFRPVDISVIFKEIRRVPGVRGIVADLENWIITDNDGSCQAVPVKGRSRSAARSSDYREYSIEKEERIKDVLKDIKKKKKEKENPQSHSKS